MGRGLTKHASAEYLSISESTFSDWVRRGLIPGPIPGTHRWDKKAIDCALDKLSNLETNTPSAYDKWKAGQDAHRA